MRYLSSVLIIFTALFSFFSCSPKEAKFIIINQSGRDIDSLWIDHSTGTIHHQKRISIKKEDSVDYIIKMPSEYIDGDYHISVFSDGGKHQFKQFGYYTNGAQVEEEYIITVLQDTIIEKVFYDSY